LIQLIRPRAKNVVVLTVATVNLIVLVACLVVHVASFAGLTPSSAALALSSVSMILWTLVTYSVVGDVPGVELGSRQHPAARPRWYRAVWITLILYFAATAVLSSGPPRDASGALPPLDPRANWRMMSALGLAWLHHLAYVSVLAGWHLHRRTLPRARLWSPLGYHSRHHDQHRRQDS
jgi:hypothetical protein